MKAVIFSILAVNLVFNSPSAFAVSDYFSQVTEQDCPEAESVKGDSAIICKGIKGAKQVFTARRDREIAKLPHKVDSKDAQSLGIVPDADHELVEVKNYSLVSSTLVGYEQIEVWNNTELDSKIAVLFRYQATSGQLISIEVQENAE